jgi:2-amino-4-hydroxy-6-hydroxymethyldihydropteridine diphosphokinase
MFTGLRVSSFYETVPVGVAGPQPLFLNAAAVGDTAMTAAQTLEHLLDIEEQRGRTRTGVGDARTLDLDLVLFGSAVINEPSLVVPHPRFRERLFVLEPLAEIAPDLSDPVSGATIAQLLARVRTAGRTGPP